MLAVYLILCYLLGSIPASIICCRVLKGIDIRKYGSGNAGATNVMRVAGWRVALFVLAVDVVKGMVAVKLGIWVKWFSGSGPEMLLPWIPIFGGLMAVVGHVWTVFAGFKGGKGIGAGLGVFLALSPACAAVALLFFIAVVYLTRYVSLGSICAVLCNAILNALLLFGFSKAGAHAGPVTMLAWFTALFVVFTHRANIKRLVSGTENKIGKKVEVKSS